MEHTPGPWKVKSAEFKENGVVAYEIIMPRAEIGQANADLIAAAPELLAAVKMFLAHLEDGTLVRDIRKDGDFDWSLKMINFVRELQQAQKAVDKAEGRTTVDA